VNVAHVHVERLLLDKALVAHRTAEKRRPSPPHDLVILEMPLNVGEDRVASSGPWSPRPQLAPGFWAGNGELALGTAPSGRVFVLSFRMRFFCMNLGVGSIGKDVETLGALEVQARLGHDFLFGRMRLFHVRLAVGGRVEDVDALGALDQFARHDGALESGLGDVVDGRAVWQGGRGEYSNAAFGEADIVPISRVQTRLLLPGRKI